MYCIPLLYLRAVILNQVPLIINQLSTIPISKPLPGKGFGGTIAFKNSGLATVPKYCGLFLQAFIKKTSGVFTGPGKPNYRKPSLHGRGRGLILDLIESICKGHRYLELFKQNNRANWDSWRLEE